MPSSKAEENCREIVERIFGCKFPSVRLKFLKNPETNKLLEIDIYNENKKIGFEYQGKQHYIYPNIFHKSEEEFIAQIRRDDYKRKKCKKLGIKLYIIPFNILEDEMEDYIKNLIKNKKNI